MVGLARQQREVLRRDLVRLEGFGAVHYQRTSGTTRLFADDTARLLAASASAGELGPTVLEAFLADRQAARDPRRVAAFAREVADLQKDGVVDPDYRVRARVVDGRPRGATMSAPLVTHVQLTHACNLACTHCYFPVSPRAHEDELDTAAVIRLFEELSAIGCPVVVLAGGEPLRRADFFDLLAALARCELDATLCTNATLITEEVAERLAASPLRGVNVSLDGPDPETHDHLRGEGQFVRAVAGTRRLLAAGAREVKLRVTVTAHNHDRLLGLAAVARDLGVQQVVFKPFDQAGVASGAPHLALDRRTYLDSIDRLRERWPADAPTAILSDGMPTRPPPHAPVIPTFGCVGGTTNATVMPNGQVVGCGAVAPEGAWSLRDHTFQQCWLDSGELGRWRRLLDNEQCRSCANLTICGGGCRARALGVGRRFSDPDPFAECSLYTPAAATAITATPTHTPAAGSASPARASLRPLPLVR